MQRWQKAAAGGVLAVSGTGPALGEDLVLAFQTVSGFNASQTAVAYPPGQFGRFFVLQQTGVIRIVENGEAAFQPFLNFSSLVRPGVESGALGLAFDPDYAANGYFYVVHTKTVPSPGLHQVVLARYTVDPADPDRADPASRLEVLSTQETFVHNAGWIGFGPDGYLYLSRGDGNATFRASDPNDLFGKVLRIDVRGDDFPADPARNYAIPPDNPYAPPRGGGAPEVWASGFRNPWRASFDRETGDLWITDVGDSSREEINFQPRYVPGPEGNGAEVAGRRYGWPCLEGTLARPDLAHPACAEDAALTPPLLELARGEASCVVGGYVYRGCAYPALRGRFVFADCTARLFSLDPADPAGSMTEHTRQVGLSGFVTSMGEDEYGELYVLPGAFKIVPPPGTVTDCNGNGVPDGCDILDGTSQDADDDGLPDECDGPVCRADYDGVGGVAVADIFAFLAAWFAGEPGADFDDSGMPVNVADIFSFLAAWFERCG